MLLCAQAGQIAGVPGRALLLSRSSLVPAIRPLRGPRRAARIAAMATAPEKRVLVRYCLR